MLAFGGDIVGGNVGDPLMTHLVSHVGVGRGGGMLAVDGGIVGGNAGDIF